MWTFLAGIASAIAAGFKFVNDWRQSRRDALLREAGADRQKVSNLESDKRKASNARKTREDVDRAGESELDDGLRKYARKRPL